MKTWNEKTIYQQLDKTALGIPKKMFLHYKGYLKKAKIKDEKKMIKFLIRRSEKDESTILEELYFDFGVIVGLQKAKDILEKEKL